MQWIKTLPCALVICACSDTVGPTWNVHQEGLQVSAWIGRYASAAETVIVDGTPTSVRAQLSLYDSSACQLNAKFSGSEPDDWEVCHTESCMYCVECGAFKLTFKMRFHFPGGDDVRDLTAVFEPTQDGTALIWRDLGVTLYRVDAGH